MPDPIVYTFADCRVDPSTRELVRSGHAVALEPRVFDLLCHLLAHRDRVVPKQELLDAVWLRAEVSEAVIHRAVVKLRAALGDQQRQSRLVRTVHRVGYRFVALVHEATEAAAAAPAPQEPEAAALTTHSGGFEASAPSVALMGFVNATGDPGLDWAAWALPRWVCHQLASHPGLRLVDLNAVAAAREALGGASGAHQVARLLGARWAVSGRVEAAADGGLSLVYEIHDGPPGARHLHAADVPGLAESLGQALVEATSLHAGWAVQTPPQDDFAQQVMRRAQGHMARTEWHEAAGLLKVLVDMAPENTAARLLWLSVLPQLHDDSALAQAQQLLAEARRRGDLRLQAATHEVLGRAAFNRRVGGPADDARRHLEEALRLAAPWSHEDWVLRIRLNLAYVLQLQGEPGLARSHYLAARRRLEPDGNARYLSATLNNLALLECTAGRPALGADLAAEAERLCAQHELFHTGVTCAATLALAEGALGRQQIAARLALQAVARAGSRPHLDPDSAAWALFVAAQLGIARRDETVAVEALQALRQRLGSTSAHVNALAAAVDALCPLLRPQPTREQHAEAADALLEVMRRSRHDGLHEHTQHLAGLALECALRARSAASLVRLRRFTQAEPGRAPEAPLACALHRADAAEALWRGDTDGAMAALRTAVKAGGAGFVQAQARLDLLWFELARDAAGDSESLEPVQTWLESTPEGLTVHAAWLASRGDFDAAVDAQLAALRRSPRRRPAAWYAHLDRLGRRLRPQALGDTLPSLL